MEQRDVRLGNATLPAHADGGWALPGGGQTLCNLEALGVAAEMDRLIGGREVPKRACAKLASRVVRQPAVVTHRVAVCTRLVQSRV